MPNLKAAYSAESAYQVLERIFADNFHLLESGPKAKQNKELTSDCLQSADDLEATYRTKGTGRYKGYIANLTETCDPESELQLITKVQVAPNNTEDAQLLAEALPNLKERTGVETMITDSGYGGEASDAALQAQDVNLVQTAIRGLQPNPDKFHLSDFDLHADEQGYPVTLTCPHGQTAPVTPARISEWQARFEGHLRRLSLPANGTLLCQTLKTRPAGLSLSQLSGCQRVYPLSSGGKLVPHTIYQQRREK